MPTLIDTNILVYAAGADGDRDRQQIAVRALRAHREDGLLAVQVLAEFANVLIRKGRPLETIQRDVTTLERSWRVIAPNSETVSAALVGVQEHKMSFWDAMLWACAKQHHLATILSEDGPIGATIGGILYKSPF